MTPALGVTRRDDVHHSVVTGKGLAVPVPAQEECHGVSMRSDAQHPGPRGVPSSHP